MDEPVPGEVVRWSSEEGWGVLRSDAVPQGPPGAYRSTWEITWDRDPPDGSPPPPP